MKNEQRCLMDSEFRKIAEANETMLDLLFGANPITDLELAFLVDARPAVYGKYAQYIGTRNR